MNNRLGWHQLPGRVRSAVEAILGSPVVSADSQSGGYSPGSADRVLTKAGGRFFVKAVGSEPNPDSPGLHRREARVMELLPAHLPVPKLAGVYDDGDWVAVVLADVEGRHPRLSGSELHRVLDAVDLLAAAADALRGDQLVHVDLRADNILLTGDGGAILVDWPWAARGASWFDALTVLVDARVGDPGGDTEAALRQHRAFAGAPDEHIDAAQGAPRRTAGTRRRCSGKSPGWGKVSFVVPQERPRILDHPAAAVAQW
ncbi:phosphotransferase [Arthrobacter sp. KBS0702]|uniref:phosphotransferase n=1 Tax=Arthrobacter sp. KBS0702 TaxID=2578107 RepID=UPI00110E88B9|nr:phosphotransferase [Arthrobacter sp. KBS0702]QDW31066.1 phosphotransferase [Arthrobacter sp. KBS0702]